MRLTERSVLLWATATVVPLSVAIALVRDNVRGFYFPFSEAVLAVVFLAAGSIIAKSHPTHAVGRLLMWMGLVGALAQLATAFDPTFVEDPTDIFSLPGVVAGVLRFATIVLLLALIARFPDGGWTTPWARRLFYLCTTIIVLFLALTSVGVLGILPVTEQQAIAFFGLMLPASALLAIVVLVHLLRSDPVRRRQVGWVLLALGLASASEVVIEGLGLELGALEGLARAALVALVPLSIVLAVTRYRLYEIDRVISRTVSYGIVIAAMALVYLGVFFGLGSLLDLGGDTEVALATLAAVAVSVPLFRRVRGWVDRRFFRSRYDSAGVVARVAEDLRTTVDLEEVEARTEAVIEEVFAPEGVTVWLATGS